VRVSVAQSKVCVAQSKVCVAQSKVCVFLGGPNRGLCYSSLHWLMPARVLFTLIAVFVPLGPQIKLPDGPVSVGKHDHSCGYA